MSTYGARESAGALEGIMGAMTRNPEGLLLLAAGAALLLRSGGQSSKPSGFRVIAPMIPSKAPALSLAP